MYLPVWLLLHRSWRPSSGCNICIPKLFIGLPIIGVIVLTIGAGNILPHANAHLLNGLVAVNASGLKFTINPGIVCVAIARDARIGAACAHYFRTYAGCVKY